MRWTFYLFTWVIKFVLNDVFTWSCVYTCVYTITKESLEPTQNLRWVCPSGIKPAIQGEHWSVWSSLKVANFYLLNNVFKLMTLYHLFSLYCYFCSIVSPRIFSKSDEKTLVKRPVFSLSESRNVYFKYIIHQISHLMWMNSMSSLKVILN